MHTIWIALVLLLAVSSSTTAMLGQVTLAGGTPNSVVAFVYVGTDFQTTPGMISAFKARANGSLMEVNGSPFTGLAQNLVVSSAFLWGNDLNNITTYARSSDGALQATATINGHTNGDPSGSFSGIGEMARDRSATDLYVRQINFDGADDNAYGEFTVAQNGTPQFLANSQISTQFQSRLSFTQDNQFAYGEGCSMMNWAIFAFQRPANGILQPFDPGNTIPPDPNPNDSLCPRGLAVSAKGFVAVPYETVPQSGPFNLITYQITSTGSLQQNTNSIVATNSATTVAVKFDPTGNFLAVVGDGGIEAFQLNADGTLTLLSSLTLPGVVLTDVDWDTAGHVYAISNTEIFVFTLQGQQLVPTGTPQLVAHAGNLAVIPAR